ncbi:unnamed protein product [Cuscuta epithymum]|uniref:Ubiquitin-like protease family profile domain-containing protein n=1 Tax=Cuscuta epithymum TaxID=186058 RepID=A0AAV0DPU5_9ASTE|nr:unnamed protein product [Cuscuta epithymum]
MENIQGVAEARLLDEELGLLEVIKADGKEKRKNKQVASKGKGKLRTKEVLVNTKKGKFASTKGKTQKDKPECSSKATKRKASKETDEDESYEESEEEISKRGVKKMMLRRFDQQVKQNFKMMAELRDLKNKQNKQEVMLTKLIRLMKELSKNVKKMNTEGKASRAEELIDGNKAGSEKQTESINNNGLDAEATNEEPPKQPQVQDEATDNVVIPTPCSGPGFKISNMEAETEESGSSENEGVLQQNIDLDKNKNDEQIATAGNGSKSTVGDTQEEVQEKSNDKEEEARLNRSGSKENEKTKTNSGAEKNKKRGNDRDDEDVDTVWSEENTQFIRDLCMNVDMIERQVFGEKKEQVNQKLGSKVQETSTQTQRAKRTAKSPVRYTPAGQTADAKRRRKEKAKRIEEEEFLPPRKVIYGPFSEDPTDPIDEQQAKLFSQYLQIGLLKVPKKEKNETRRYKNDDEKLITKPLVLDMMKIESKTWLHDLWLNHQWLKDTHVEVGMYYLEMKRVHFKLKQKYSTTGPFFIQIIKREHDMILDGKTTLKEAADKEILSQYILGTATNFSLHWADCDFVYMPLNTGSHWVLLVFVVKERKIKVYNSNKRRSDSLRDILQYKNCITKMLPKILDFHNVYEAIDEEPMGKREILIEGVADCPQQDTSGNCGMYLLKIAEFLMMDMDLCELTADGMGMFRKKMVLELIEYSNKRLSEGTKK